MNTEKILQINSTSSAQTEQIGEQIGLLLHPMQVIELIADLGGGKTTLVKGLARGLGYKGDVISPTFTLSREYPCRDGIVFYHYDFYRLNSAGIMSSELAESIVNKKAINIIEWADSVLDVLPASRLKISIKFSADDQSSRIINFIGPSELISKIKKTVEL